jgi:hypothetical protein
MELEGSLQCSLESDKSETLCDIKHGAFLRRGVVSPSPNPQAGGPALVSRP